MTDWIVDEEALKIDIPDGFHSNKLGAFNTQAYTNSLATYRSYPSVWRLLSRISAAHEKLLDNLFNAKPMLPAFLIHRAHSAYLGATRLTVSTQALDAYPLMRSALEYGLYAVYFKDDPELGDLWQKRHESEENRKKVRRAVTIGKFIAYLQNKDRRLKNMVEKLYESTIDFGGHPNVYGVTGGIETQDDPDKEVVLFQNNTLVGDEPIFHLCCWHTAAVGIAVLELMCLVYPERAGIIGVTDTARALREDLAHFSKALNKYFETNYSAAA
jgi:hypothetical protein